jgi:iron complex transport system substrate-binding protein
VTADTRPKHIVAYVCTAAAPRHFEVAGQVTPWLSGRRFSHAGCAPLAESVARAVQGARKVR